MVLGDMEDAMKIQECPFCFLDLIIEETYFKRLLNNVLDEDYREEWNKGGGLCPEHALMLLNKGSATGHAILYQDLIENWKNIWLEGNFNCPACERIESNFISSKKAFIWGIKNAPSFKKRFQNSAGLCRKHFVRVYEGLDTDLADLLLQVQEKAFLDLNNQLELLLRQHDYNYQEKKDTKAARSWRKAARYWGGGTEKKWRF